jgi:predicted peroxiredoxin
MGKVSITINGAKIDNIFTAVIIGVSAAASGDEVLYYVTPAGLPAFVKGAMEKLNDEAENLPDLPEMMEGLNALGARFLICELGFAVNGIEEKDLIEGCEVVGATTFIAEAQGSNLTFSF